MRLKDRVLFGSLAIMILALTGIGQPAQAYLYWQRPDFSGPAVVGDEPGITLALPGAKPAEVQANLLWTLRAAMNVAALQCQFSTALRTVPNYNTILSQHGTELTGAFTTIGGYFKRTQGKNWQRAFDQHTTRIYNGLSTFHAQIGFCETSSKVGKMALAERRGQLIKVAQQYMSEIRNSLVPAGDRFFAFRIATLPAVVTLPSFSKACWDGRGYLKKKCRTSGQQ